MGMIHLVHRYLVSSYCVPGTILDVLEKFSEQKNNFCSPAAVTLVWEDVVDDRFTRLALSRISTAAQLPCAQVVAISWETNGKDCVSCREWCRAALIPGAQGTSTPGASQASKVTQPKVWGEQAPVCSSPRSCQCLPTSSPAWCIFLEAQFQNLQSCCACPPVTGWCSRKTMPPLCGCEPFPRSPGSLQAGETGRVYS